MSQGKGGGFQHGKVRQIRVVERHSRVQSVKVLRNRVSEKHRAQEKDSIRQSTANQGFDNVRVHMLGFTC